MLQFKLLSVEFPSSLCFSIVVEGVAGRIGHQTVMAILNSSEPGSPIHRYNVSTSNILAFGSVSLEEYVALLQGKLEQRVIDEHTKSRKICDHVVEIQPAILSADQIWVEEGDSSNALIKVQRGDSITYIRYMQTRRGVSDADLIGAARHYGAQVWATCTGHRTRYADFMAMANQVRPMVLVGSHPVSGQSVALAVQEVERTLIEKLLITNTRNNSPTGTRFTMTIDLALSCKIDRETLVSALRAVVSNACFDNLVAFDKIKAANEVVGSAQLIHLDPDSIVSVNKGKKLIVSYWEDNEAGYAVCNAKNILAALSALQSSNFAGSVLQGAAIELVTNIMPFHGPDPIQKAVPHVAVASSSCTTNANLLALLLFGSAISAIHSAKVGSISGWAQNELQDAAVYAVTDLFEFVHVQMEHARTPSESPDITMQLRVKASGSQVEVPRVLAQTRQPSFL